MNLFDKIWLFSNKARSIVRVGVMFAVVMLSGGAQVADAAAGEHDVVIRARFAEVTKAVVALDAGALVSAMHGDTVKSLADFFREERKRREISDDGTEVVSSEAFVVGILSEAFKRSPMTFAFPTRDTMRIHGVVYDDAEAFVVYSTASEHDGFRSPATLTFRQDQGVWKLWSMPLARLAVGTWPSGEK